MLITYPYRNNLSAYTAGFASLDGGTHGTARPQCRWRASGPGYGAGGREKLAQREVMCAISAKKLARHVI